MLVLAPIELFDFFKNILCYYDSTSNSIFDDYYQIYFSKFFKDKKSWYVFESSNFDPAMFWSIKPVFDNNFLHKDVDIKLVFDESFLPRENYVGVGTMLNGVALLGNPKAAKKIKNI